jgi:class 3 adenylate cyclase
MFRRYWYNLPLASKIASLMSLLVLLTIIALTFISIQRERANFEKELAEKADLFLETTSLGIRDQLYRLQLDELVEISSSVRDNPDIDFFIIYDPNGKVLVDSRQTTVMFSQQPDPLGERLIKLKTEDIYLTREGDQLITGRVILLGKQVLGAASVGFSTHPLDEKILAITTQSLTLALITLLIGALLTVIFSRQITRPLSDLNSVVARMSAGDLLQRVKYTADDEIGQLGTAFNQMVVQLQEREWLRDMFGRFVSHEVADAIRTGQVKLEGENRSVSVLFCDIRDFTDFSETHTPQEVVTLLNQFLPLVVYAAQQHGGMVNKFGGDSTLIIYGAPHDIQDSAYQAVLTALDIRYYIQQLNEKFQINGENVLRVGVGINTGVALAGAIGPNERQEYTVIGNTVNLAARIDGLNKQFPEHDILISGWTYEALDENRDKFNLKSLGTIPIRGKNEPVEIWAVESLK